MWSNLTCGRLNDTAWIASHCNYAEIFGKELGALGAAVILGARLLGAFGIPSSLMAKTNRLQKDKFRQTLMPKQLTHQRPALELGTISRSDPAHVPLG